MNLYVLIFLENMLILYYSEWEIVFRPAQKAQTGNKQKCLCHLGSPFFRRNLIDCFPKFCDKISTMRASQQFLQQTNFVG